MNEALRRIGRTLWLALLLGLLGVPLAMAGPTVSIGPTLATAGVGSFVDITVDITAVTDLYAYQFDLDFDPLILSALSIDEGPFLQSGGTTFFLPGMIDNALGSITFTANSLIGAVPGANGDGTLVVARFFALGLGSSQINLSGMALIDSTLTDISFTSVGGTVVVSSVVPEPGGMLLVGVGLLALIGASRRRWPLGGIVP